MLMLLVTFKYLLYNTIQQNNDNIITSVLSESAGALLQKCHIEVGGKHLFLLFVPRLCPVWIGTIQSFYIILPNIKDISSQFSVDEPFSTPLVCRSNDFLNNTIISRIHDERNVFLQVGQIVFDRNVMLPRHQVIVEVIKVFRFDLDGDGIVAKECPETRAPTVTCSDEKRDDVSREDRAEERRRFDESLLTVEIHDSHVLLKVIHGRDPLFQSTYRCYIDLTQLLL